MNTVNVASRGLVLTRDTRNPLTSWSTVRAAEPSSEPIHMRRHGMAAPDRNRNSTARASVSMANTTTKPPTCTRYPVAVDTVPSPRKSVNQPRSEMVIADSTAATRSAVPNTRAARKSRAFSSA